MDHVGAARRPLARTAAAVLCALVVLGSLLAGSAATAETGTGAVAGRVAAPDGTSTRQPWTVEVGRWAAGSWTTVASADVVVADGTYRVEGLPEGTYRVRAVPGEEHTHLPAMWHGDTLRVEDADDVLVRAGRTTSGVGITVLDPGGLETRATAVWRPFVKGTPKVGWTLTVDPGRWVTEDDWRPDWELDDAALALQWLADGTPVPGATATTFTPGPEQLGARLSVVVRAADPGLVSDVVTTDPTAATAAGTNRARSRVLVEGPRRVGRLLVARHDGWTAPGTATAYRWYVDGRRVAGAVGRTFRPPSRYRGDRVSVRLTGTAPGYAPAQSASPRTARLR